MVLEDIEYPHCSCPKVRIAEQNVELVLEAELLFSGQMTEAGQMVVVTAL
jgi:hypothetical protein